MKSFRKQVSTALAFFMLSSSFGFHAAAATDGQTGTESALRTAYQSDAGLKAKLNEMRTKRHAQGSGSHIESTREPDEEVRVIVELHDLPVALTLARQDRGFKTASSETVNQLRAELQAKQAQVAKSIQASGIALKQRAQYTNTLNGFSGVVPFADIEKLEKTPGVKAVHVANQYKPLRSTSVPHIGADHLTVGATSLTGEGLTIAIIDSGIDYRHAEFGDIHADYGADATEVPVGTNDLTEASGYTDIVIGGYNHADRTNDVIDRNENTGNHGTHVAGIAGGAHGVAPAAKLLAEKVFSNDPGVGTAYSDDIIAGIEHAIEHGADIINMSLGASYGYVDADDPESIAVQRAIDAGVVVVVAAGNDGSVVFPDEGAWKDYATVGSPGTWPGALTVAASDYSGLGNEGSITDFSSWGVTPDLGLKPNITAPGHLIESAVEYPYTDSLSGTSMATPHVAGAAALVKQAMALKGWTPAPTAADIKAALANTSLILKDTNGVPFLPLAQGSGLVQVDQAVNTPVVVTGTEGEAQVSLREIESNTFSFTLTLNNLSDSAVSYTAGNTSVYTEDIVNGEVVESAIDGAAVTFDSGTVVVPADGTAEVTATVTLPEALTQGRYVGGWITLASSGLPELVVPYLGYYGDWNAVPLFNEKATNTAADNLLNQNYATYLWVGSGGYDYTFENVDASKLAMSAVSDFADEGAKLYYSQLRYADRLSVELLNADGEVLRVLDERQKQPKSFEAFANWGGTVFNPATGELEPAAEGEYSIRVKAIPALGDSGNAADWQTLEFPFLVDNTAPVVEFTAAQGDPGSVLLELTGGSDQGGAGMWGYNVLLNGEDPDDYEVFYSPTSAEIELTGLTRGLYDITVQAIDYAGNVTEVTEENVAVDADFIYSGPTEIEAPNGVVTLDWEATGQIGKVEVLVDGAVEDTVTAASEITMFFEYDDYGYDVTLKAYGLDNMTVVGEADIDVYVNAVTNVAVTAMDGSDDDIALYDSALVTYSVSPEAVDTIAKVVITVDTRAGVLAIDELTDTEIALTDGAGTYTLENVQIDYDYVNVEVYNVDDVRIGYEYDVIWVDAADVSLDSIEGAYAVFDDEYFKVPTEQFTVNLTVTDQVYRLDVLADHWGQPGDPTVIESLYNPGNSLAIDLGDVPFYPNNNYNVDLVGFGENGEVLDSEAIDVLVYDPGPIKADTDSEWPVFRSDDNEAAVSWTIAENETPPASYSYEVYAEQDPLADLVSVGEGTLHANARSLGIDVSTVMNEGDAFVYLYAHDGPDGSGNRIGEYFFLIRADNDKPVIDIDDLSPDAGDVLSSPIEVEDLYVYDFSKVTVRINGTVAAPSDEYIDFYWGYEYELDAHSLPMEDGFQIITIEATDEAGNTSRFDRKILVDSTPPVIALGHGNAISTTATSYTVSGTVSDAQTLHYVKVNGDVIYYDAMGLNFGREKEVPVEYTVDLALGANKVNIVASDLAGNETIQEIVITRTTPRRGGGGGGGRPAEPPAAPAGELGVELGEEAAAVTMETTPDGKPLTKVTLNAEKLGEAFGLLKEQGQRKVTLNLGTTGDATEVEIPAGALREAAQLAVDGLMEIKTDGASYELPIGLLDIGGLAEQLNASIEDLKINVLLEKVTGETADDLKAKAKAAGFTLLGDAMEFRISVEANGETREVNDFGATYVTRTITIGQSIDGTQATAVIFDPATGSMQFVPAEFEVVKGQTQVIIKRNGNSIYTVVQSSKAFDDTSSHWAKADIELLASKLVLNGTSGTTFSPDLDVTRAEFAAMLVRSLGLTQTVGTKRFTDISSSDWYAGAVGIAANAGLVTGYEDGTFRPQENITREQMAVMIARAVSFAGKEDGSGDFSATFADADQIGAWALPAVRQTSKAGIVMGMPDGRFAPSEQATRAQATVMLKRLLQHLDFMN